MNYSKSKYQRITLSGFAAQIRHRDKTCLVGLFRKDGSCSGELDCHHIETRGSGGDDVEENGITLCRFHHNDAHAGRITVRELHDILNYYYHYTGI